MNAEPFDPSPQSDHEVAENYIAQACERWRKAFAVLEHTDPELARELFEIHQTMCSKLNDLR